MIETKTLHKDLREIIGSITPSASHGTDIERLENLKTNCELIIILLDELCEVANSRDSCAYSTRLLGETAYKCLCECSEIIENIQCEEDLEISFKLSSSGLEKLGNLNEKYNIQFFKIDSDSVRKTIDKFLWLIDNTCIIQDDDLNWIQKIAKYVHKTPL